MLQNAYFVAKIGADTAENEQHFPEILPKTGNYPTGPKRPGVRFAPNPVHPAWAGGASSRGWQEAGRAPAPGEATRGPPGGAPAAP